MSDSRPYGTHQHAAPGAVLAHSRTGQPVDHPTVNAVGASPATFSSAAFVAGPKPQGHGPPRRNRVASGGQPLCQGLDDTCKRWRLVGSIYCHLHDPKRAK